MTHFVIGGVVFLWGWGRVSTRAARAVTAVTLTVQAESDGFGGTRQDQRSNTHRLTDRKYGHTALHYTCVLLSKYYYIHTRSLPWVEM